ncbi:MAG: glycosyl transferase [Bacteroidetes bacterium]|nr:glycosyl transferase [Bacteroidota bacterium]
MKIVFTLCSNNYLAQAKTLGDSLIKFNPDYVFYIGLVDRLAPQIDYQSEISHQILTVEDIGISDFDDLWKKYNIIELNTCVKPVYFKYLFEKHPEADLVFYFDPDIQIFSSLDELENEFNSNVAVLLTPHILSPIPIDSHTPFENTFLNYGIYNLGFLGLKKCSATMEILNWWQDRTLKFGFMQPKNGLFVDQLWFNFVPLFFDKVRILEAPSFNMAPWNLHERNLTMVNDKYIVNEDYPLVFYHFSNYKYTSADQIANYYTRFQLRDFPILKKIYDSYLQTICENNIQKLSKLECYFVKAKILYAEELYKNKIQKSKREKFKHILRKVLPAVLIRMYNAI